MVKILYGLFILNLSITIDTTVPFFSGQVQRKKQVSFDEQE